MIQRLAGKVAFVTGAARGQGRAHAVRLASEGADIVAFDIAGPIPHVVYDSPTPEDLAETVRQVENQDRRIVAVQGDVRDHARLLDAAAQGVAELGKIDIVVANAGICLPQVWSDITPETFRFHIDTNLTGVWNTVMACAPHVIAAGGGSIVLISSLAGKKVVPFMVHYTAAKHGVTGLARAFAAELGRHNIRVNSVHPGAVATPMGSGGMQQLIGEVSADNPLLNQMGSSFLPEWSCEPEAIAAAVAFLASDEAGFITAENLSIDGGAQHF